MTTEKITTAKELGLKLWIQTEPEERFSLAPIVGFDTTTQVPGWELVFFHEPAELTAYMRALDRHSKLEDRFTTGLMVLKDKPLPVLLIEIEEWEDYLELVETAGGHEGDLIVRLPA